MKGWAVDPHRPDWECVCGYKGCQHTHHHPEVIYPSVPIDPKMIVEPAMDLRLLSGDRTADGEPYKITVNVRMMDGTNRTFLVNRTKSVYKIWKALGKIWEL